MLHEVLLALSGHPSPLFDQTSAETFPLVTPAESALLASIGRLATLHRALKSHLTRISSHHPSLICRAVASSISSAHLSKFQDLILHVEQQILTKNPSTVGAYDIVPLAGILSTFEPWRRRLSWYWDLACFMYPADAEPLSADATDLPNPVCNGCAVLDRLRSDCQTGYPDIEEAALALLAVAERAWIRQLSVWLLNGSISENAKHDFFIHRQSSVTSSTPYYYASTGLVPNFVTKDTANSVLFIGKTLGMLTSNLGGIKTKEDSLVSSASNLTLQPGIRTTTNTSHLKELARLQSPISSSVFASLITSLRSSLAAQVVHEMLPMHLFMKALFLLRRFLLVGRGDFTDALIAEADSYIAFRHQQTRVGSQKYSSNDLAGVMMKEGEVSAVLAKTWSTLASSISKEQVADEELEWAREHLALALKTQPDSAVEMTKSADTKSSSAELPQVPIALFEELLLSIPTKLSLRLDSAFDLFLGENELQTYSSVYEYLLGIRRAHNHLSDAWRQTALRRDHPAPIRRGRAKKAFQILRDARRKRAARMGALRKVWCTCNNGVVTLAELGEYLSGEVIDQSWNAFHAWAFQTNNKTMPLGSPSRRAPESPDTFVEQSRQLPHDPEIIAQGHRQYLQALVEGLMLTDKTYANTLKSLFTHVDQLVAFLKRLESVQREIDLRDEGVMISGKRNYEEEEQDVHGQLEKSSKMVENDLERLMSCLQELSSKPSSWISFKHSPTGFEPYSSRTGIDSLLMKLELRTTQAGND